MIRFAIGMAVGIFLAQNYKVPDIKTQITIIQQSLIDLEKDHSKKNDR
jgi:hypothetical protein